jgi:hypothetical protein
MEQNGKEPSLEEKTTQDKTADEKARVEKFLRLYEEYDRQREMNKHIHKSYELVKSASFKITYGQLEKIRPYLPNVDELLNDIGEFQGELNDAIVFQLDDDYEDTDVSLMLQIIYDEIYDQNED